MLYRTHVTHALIAILLLAGLISSASASQAPDFTLQQPEYSLNLQQYRGQVVYLDFWASWCSPCRKSFPWMNALHERYADDGLVVLAVNLDQDSDAARRFLQRYPAQFNVVFDPQGKVAERYQLKGMPSSYLIDRQGKLVMTHTGFRTNDADLLEARIKSLLDR